jgi:Photosystem I reaction centre subunit IX / PsaJ
VDVQITKNSGGLPMKYFLKYLTSAPIIATLTMVILAGVLIELNRLFPGLQYGTYFHSLP